MKEIYTSTKTYRNLPCAHRQWKHDGHCAYVHGYSREYTFYFEARSLDQHGWVVGFGDLKELEEARLRVCILNLCVLCVYVHVCVCVLSGYFPFLVFRMYNQELHVSTTLSQVEQYLGKVCGKNYLNDELLYKKFVG